MEMAEAQGTLDAPAPPRWARTVTDVGAPWVLNAVVPLLFAAALGDLWWGLFVSAVSGIIPILMICAMMLRRRVGDVHVTDRAGRTAVIGGIIGIAGAGLAIEVLAHAPSWVVVVTAAGVATIVLIGVVTVLGRWKVSVHTAVAGGWIVLAAGLVSPWALCAAPLAAVIGWSRVVLGDHTRAQVLAGTALGAIVTGVALLFA